MRCLQTSTANRERIIKTFYDLTKSVGRQVPEFDQPAVCVQGLGFVGTAMAIAIADARSPAQSPYFNVIGIDQPTRDGWSKIGAINAGRLPFRSADAKLYAALKKAHSVGNLIATADPEVYSLASTIVVDVHYEPHNSSLGIDDFRAAIRDAARFMQPGCLMIIEATVPPGICEKVVAPELKNIMQKRGLPQDSFLLAHSYERIMPGEHYYDSIVNFWRVYAGYTPKAANACEAFLSKIIDVSRYPLTRLSSTTASEIGKVLENSYRAVTIAFMEEWGRFAEAVGIDLFEVITAIRKRPTHSNIRQPGFGVGGYCLTKDPMLAALAARELFGLPDKNFPFCQLALATNRTMPLASLDKIQRILGGSLKGKSILLLGVSYRQGIGDTRFSPAQVFVEHAHSRGATVICCDPFVEYWPELDEQVLPELPSSRDIDAIVFAVPHDEYKTMDIKA